MKEKKPLLKIFVFEKANENKPGFDYFFYNYIQENNPLGGGHLGNNLKESKEKIIKIINKQINNSFPTIVLSSENRIDLDCMKLCKEDFLNIYVFIKREYPHLEIKSSYYQWN